MGGSEELGDCEEIDHVCTKCTLPECQFIVEFAEVRQDVFGLNYLWIFPYMDSIIRIFQKIEV